MAQKKETTVSRKREKSRSEIMAERRKVRDSIGGIKNVMTVPDIDGYVVRWVNDVENRIESLLRVGWSLVTDEVTVGAANNVTERNTAKGSGARMDVGQGVTAVLMKIPVEIYEADQLLKEESIAETERAIMDTPKSEGMYGNITINNKGW